MSKQNRSYRIKTDLIPGQNTKLNVKLDQNFDTFDILSLKINQENFYKFHSANYGVVIGKIIANGGIGVPNTKISVFIKRNEETKENVVKNILYPYDSSATKNLDGIKYNLLPNEQLDECHRIIGTFPSKRRILDNNSVLEIYDEYYKYSTVSNSAGDYMLFGLPLGENTIHVDLDLSDCGFLSQKPRDMFYKGYNTEQFDSPLQFKKDTNLDNLSQIFRQDGMAFVYPFWGDETEEEIAITRYDIDISYKFEPTCVFLGSAITDGEDSIIHKTCQPQRTIGEMSKLTSKQGKIQMIRKTFDGIIERFQIKGDALIDGDGVWCYQIPMNLDYVITDEYGNIVPTDNPNKGIATRAEVRFRFILEQSEGTMRQRANYLVPMNPNINLDTGFYNMDEVDYEFGENTLDSSFATLFWNKVYSIKSFIPRTQIDQGYRSRRFVGIKNVSNFGTNNPFPFNTLYIASNFQFILLCVIAKIVINIVNALNSIQRALTCFSCRFRPAPFWPLNNWYIDPCDWIAQPLCGMFRLMGGFVELGDGWCPYYEAISVPGGMKCPNGNKLGCLYEDLLEKYPYDNIQDSKDEIIDCVISALAEDNEVIRYDFGNDWINGTMYFPTFYYRKVKKVRRKWLGLFGPKKVSVKREFCGIINEDERAAKTKTWFRRGVSTNSLYYNCAVAYTTSDNESYNYDMMNGSNAKAGSVIGDLSGEDLINIGISDGNTNYPGDRKTCSRDNCYKQKLRVQFGNGLVNLYTDKYDEDWFYYRPYDRQKMFRLYTTDIILLGSLNDCDIDGIFQLHKYLPLTSYNMPSILKDIWIRKDEDDYTGEDIPPIDPENPDDYSSISFNGPIISTGANWGRDLGRNNEYDQIVGDNNYHYDRRSSGLFLGIDCTDSSTTNKSCVNVQRVCEVGVELDISREKYFTCDDLIKRGQVEGSDPRPIAADGFISKDELIDGIEVRQMFATLNQHRLTNDNIVEYKGHKTYMFEYMYPLNFDGKLANKDTFNYAKAEKNGRRVTAKPCIRCPKGEVNPNYQQMTNYKDEWFDKYYHQFRFGHSRIDPIHDYYDIQGLRGPRLVNSFYFHFGVKPGKTAIEQFRQKFWGTCIKDTKNDLTAQITIINHASVCSCNFTDTAKVKFLVTIRNFQGTYDLFISDEFGNIINLDIGNRAINLGINSPVDLSLIEIVFSESNDNDIHFYNQIFKDGGRYNLTISDSSGKTFTTVINILIQNIVDFNVLIAEEITGGVDFECSMNCTNNSDCICCNDYLTKPSSDNVNTLKARVQIREINNIIKKGCELCDYELMISRYQVIGKNLTIKVTGNQSSGVTAVQILNGGNGWIVTPPPGTPELTFTTSSGVTRYNPQDFIRIPGGNGGLMRISSVSNNGTVLAVEIVESGTNYNNFDSVTLSDIRVLLSRQISDLGSNSFSFNCDPKSCSDYINDMDRDMGIDLYMCSGEYEITLRNKNKDGECIFDTNTEIISITEQQSLCLTMNSGQINACNIEIIGETRNEKDCWWYWFYLWLINDNYKYDVDNTKLPLNGNPNNLPSPCPADPNTNNNWKNAPLDQGIMFWYSDFNSVSNSENSVKEWKEILRNTFIAQCDDSMNIILGGRGYAPPYVPVLFGANYPAKGGSDPSGNPLCIPCNPGTGSDANDNANKYSDIIPGCQYNIPYKTSRALFTGFVTSLNSICNVTTDGQLIPDGVALTLSRIPKVHPCGVWSNYESGGYYAGIMGMAGFGVGWPSGLGGIIKEIRGDNGQIPCQPPDPSIGVKFEQIWDKLISMGFSNAANENLFYFHIIDRRLKILLEYARVSAFKSLYAKPEDKNQDLTECSTRDIHGFFSIFYKNGPNVELRNLNDVLDYEFTVDGVENVGIDHNYRLSTTDKTLPGIRHIFSTENSRILGETYEIILQHNRVTYDANGLPTGSDSICYENVSYPFGMALNYRNIKVETKVQCPAGDANANDTFPPIRVANSYCYSLNISGTEISNIGVGYFDLFKILYSANNNPESILYFPYVDQWGGNYGHFNRPFYTYDVINDLHLDNPGPAPNQDLDIATCLPIVTWNSKYISSDLSIKGDDRWNIQSVLTNIEPWVRVGNEWIENINPITGTNYNRFTCGGLPADGSGIITNNTDEIYFTIVHDGLTNVRAFSQPLDLGNYIRVCKIECDSRPNSTSRLNIYTEIVGRNAFICYGYTWTIQQGFYEYREDKPKANEQGWENYYGKDNNVSFVNNKYENSQDCWIRFIPTTNQMIYENVQTKAKNGTDPLIYSNGNNGILEALFLELDVKDRDKVVRISFTDITGTEFYMYTSVFKWIDTCPSITYCVQNSGDANNNTYAIGFTQADLNCVKSIRLHRNGTITRCGIDNIDLSGRVVIEYTDQNYQNPVGEINTTPPLVQISGRDYVSLGCGKTLLDLPPCDSSCSIIVVI
jgi:hypothetical protein